MKIFKDRTEAAADECLAQLRVALDALEHIYDAVSRIRELKMPTRELEHTLQASLIDAASHAVVVARGMVGAQRNIEQAERHYAAAAKGNK